MELNMPKSHVKAWLFLLPVIYYKCAGAHEDILSGCGGKRGILLSFMTQIHTVFPIIRGRVFIYPKYSVVFYSVVLYDEF